LTITSSQSFGGLDDDVPIADFHDGHVEGAAAEVEDEDGLVLVPPVHAEGQGGRGGLVDDAQHVEPGQLPGRDGGGALRVVEIRGHGDHGVGDGHAQVALRVLFELAQDQRGKLLGGELLVLELPGELLLALTHFPLHEVHDLLGLRDGVLFGQRADNGFASIKEDDRRGDPLTLGIGDDLRFPVIINMRDG
jgi:hypothetical protein